MKRPPFPWRELLGAVLLLLATFGASWLKPMGFATDYGPVTESVQQEPTAEAVAPYLDTPRAKGAREGVQTLQLQIDTSARRTDRAGLL